MKAMQRPMKKGIAPQKASRLIGCPVCIVLHDGSRYMGMVTELNDDRLVLAGTQVSKKRTNFRSKGTVRVSGLIGTGFGGGEVLNAQAAGAMAGGQAGAGIANGGFGGFGDLIGMLGSLKQVWPHITFGISVVKTIMPLMKGLKL
jgi:hypothetical protein